MRISGISPGRGLRPSPARFFTTSVKPIDATIGEGDDLRLVAELELAAPADPAGGHIFAVLICTSLIFERVRLPYDTPSFFVSHNSTPPTP